VTPARLGLTGRSAEILELLREFRHLSVDALCVKRNTAEVRRAIRELRRAGFVRVRRGASGRQVIELTPAGERRA
jgi:DNA-binding MarR family transcriptional regulator